jgi:hypothetical protein
LSICVVLKLVLAIMIFIRVNTIVLPQVFLYHPLHLSLLKAEKFFSKNNWSYVRSFIRIKWHARIYRICPVLSSSPTLSPNSSVNYHPERHNPKCHNCECCTPQTSKSPQSEILIWLLLTEGMICSRPPSLSDYRLPKSLPSVYISMTIRYNSHIGLWPALITSF